MSPGWFYSVVHRAGASLIAAIYVAWLNVSLRRWHLGTAARPGSIGFGLLPFAAVVQQVFSFVLPPFQASSGPTSTDSLFFRSAVVPSISVLTYGAGLLLVLRDYERVRNAMPEGMSDRTT